jgi:hypothetical protein
MDKYEEYGCDFKNESECEEELDADGIEISEAERNHYKEEGYHEK